MALIKLAGWTKMELVVCEDGSRKKKCEEAQNELNNIFKDNAQMFQRRF
jgi:hypothetical protein